MMLLVVVFLVFVCGCGGEVGRGGGADECFVHTKFCTPRVLWGVMPAGVLYRGITLLQYTGIRGARRYNCNIIYAVPLSWTLFILWRCSAIFLVLTLKKNKKSSWS